MEYCNRCSDTIMILKQCLKNCSTKINNLTNTILGLQIYFVAENTQKGKEKYCKIKGCKMFNSKATN